MASSAVPSSPATAEAKSANLIALEGRLASAKTAEPKDFAHMRLLHAAVKAQAALDESLVLNDFDEAETMQLEVNALEEQILNPTMVRKPSTIVRTHRMTVRLYAYYNL